MFALSYIFVPLHSKHNMKEKLEKIRELGLEKIDATKTIQELEDVRKDLMGKKSELAEVLKNMGSLAPEDKKSVGMMTTEIKNVFQEKLASKEEEIIASMSVLDELIDLTVPGKKVSAGALHPITQMRNDLNLFKTSFNGWFSKIFTKAWSTS